MRTKFTDLFIKKLVIIVVLSCFSLSATLLNAQCSFSGTYLTSIGLSTTRQTVNCVKAGDQINFYSPSGSICYFSFCSTDGGSANWNTQITIFNSSGIYAGGYNDDYCGQQSFVAWACPSAGSYIVQVNKSNCASDTVCATLAYWYTAPPPPCPAITVTATATPPVACTGSSQLNATGSGSWNYRCTHIPYAPILGTGNIITLTDDIISSALPIGFTFNFYGSNYTDAYLSSNGFLTFDPVAYNGCCSGQRLPDPSSPNSVIAFAWEDLAPPAGGLTGYFTQGVAPYRKFIAYFQNVPHYGSNNLDPVTSQVILYETTNVIEIHTGAMPGNPHGYWSYHTEGIENQNGSSAVAVPGRNQDDTWTCNNDAWRFYVYDYSWSPSSGLSNDTISNPIASPPTTTDYTVTVTDGAGCSSSATIAAGVGAIIQPSGMVYICPGDSVTLTANPGVSYLWSSGETTQSIWVAATGYYSVTVTDTASCVGTSSPDTVALMPGGASITAGGPLAICPGSNLSLTASQGTAWYWSTGATTQTIQVNSAGTYSVTVTYNGTCSNASLPVTVTMLPPAPAYTNPSGYVTLCANDTLTLTANSGTSYAWSTGAISQSIQVMAAGSFTVVVTDADGCSAETPVIYVTSVTPSATEYSFGPTTFCQGDSVVLYCSAQYALTYEWLLNGVHTNAISSYFDTVMVAGNYSTVITSVCGTDTSNIITVTVNPQPNIQITGDDSICAGQSSALHASGGNSYNWTPIGTLSTPIGINTVATPPITTTYYLNGSTSGGCSGIDSFTVNVLPLPVVTMSSLSPVCNTAAPFLLTGGLPAGGVYSGVGVTANTFSPAVATAGNHTIIYTYTDGYGCYDTAHVNILVNNCLGIAGAFPYDVSVIHGNDFISVEFNSAKGSELLKYRIVDVTGKILSETSNYSGEKYLFHTNYLASGIYFISVEAKGGVYREKFVLINN